MAQKILDKEKARDRWKKMKLYGDEEMKVDGGQEAPSFSENEEDIEEENSQQFVTKGHEDRFGANSDVMVITVRSAGFNNGNFAEILIDNKQIDINLNENTLLIPN